MSNIQRRDSTKLDPSDWRCCSDGCPSHARCERRLATIPKGTPLRDAYAENSMHNPRFPLHASDCGDFK